jgi:predicted N-acetyltransferase YhbS
MSDLSLTILAETANDAQVIERLHERTFGPGRFVLSAYRIREHVDHVLLGPLTVEPPFRSRGVGRLLLERALGEAKAKGHRLVLLVGDDAYYNRVGFKKIPQGRATMPGPVDYNRLLVAELADGAFDGVSGTIRPDWDFAK